MDFCVEIWYIVSEDWSGGRGGGGEGGSFQLTAGSFITGITVEFLQILSADGWVWLYVCVLLADT